MNNRILAGLLLMGLSHPGEGGAQTSTGVLVEVRTEQGTFRMELYPERAPNTVENFLRYVDGGFYDGGSFHRTVRADNQPDDSIRIAVIQADIAEDRRGERYGPIPLERTSETGLTHQEGVISMARGGPDTATSSFFICVGDEADLDFGGRRNPDGQGFAAFGRVVEGMEVIRAIHRSPARGQTLTPPVRILQVIRVEGRRF